mmetsp:Transcript_33407/g.92442  ORF Transcript_33407/g.92442 Transcript_33407/m.92442 type:complete len:219 (+) Transcript_33407:789-1445(+)
MSSISSSLPWISASISAISCSNRVMVSLSSSIARESVAALRVSSARVFSQFSLISRSLVSSSCSCAMIVSIAPTTAAKCAGVAFAMREASATRRRSPALRAASRSTAVASRLVALWRAAARVSARSCSSRYPWEERDLLNRSRASSPWRIEIAWLIAASSFSRTVFLASHSVVLVLRACSTSPMYLLSSSIWVVSAWISACASDFESPRAAPSSSILL